LSNQGPFESRKLWQSVTAAILSKKYTAATKNKQIIEQAQRDLAAERVKSGIEHVPVFFDDKARLEADDGRPILSPKGREILMREMEARGYGSTEV